jgi:hypothetical protein
MRACSATKASCGVLGISIYVCCDRLLSHTLRHRARFFGSIVTKYLRMRDGAQRISKVSDPLRLCLREVQSEAEDVSDPLECILYGSWEGDLLASVASQVGG